MPLKPGEAIIYNERFPEYDGSSVGREQSDWQGRIDMDKMRRDRLARLRAAMRDAGINVYFTLAPWNVRYATGYKGMAYTTGLAYAVVPVEDKGFDNVILYAHGTPAIQDRRNMPWFKPENIRYAIPASVGMMSSGLWTHPEALKFQRAKVVEELKVDLQELKVDKEILTFDTEDSALMRMLEAAGIKTAVNAATMIAAQEIKTPEEIECFRVLSGICDINHYELAKHAEAGMTEYELTGFMNSIPMKYGCEPEPRCFVASGPNTWPNYRNTSDRQLRPGDIFYADNIQLSWNGYKSCNYRTYSVAFKPSQAAEDAYKRVNEWLYSALSDCKPGNTTADMLKHWPDEEDWMGLPADYCWGDNVMHGIGLFNYGPPQGCKAWSMKYPYPLKEGQVFAIETQGSIGDGQGVRVEDMVVVTKDGCEVLTRFPSDHITVVPARFGLEDIEFLPPRALMEKFAGKYPPKGYRATIDAAKYPK